MEIRGIDRENVAAQLYGILADIADGLDVRPADAPFLEGAVVTTFIDHAPPLSGAGVVLRTRTGRTFHVTVTAATEDRTPGGPEEGPEVVRR